MRFLIGIKYVFKIKMSRDPEKFFVIDYMEGACGSFILTLIVNSLTGEIIRDDYDSGTGHGHFGIYTRENLDWSIVEQTNNGFDLKLQDSSKHDFAIHRGVPRSNGPPFPHAETIVNDFFQRTDFPKNLKWIFVHFNHEDRIFFQTLHYYKCDWSKYRNWFANNLRISAEVKGLLKSADEIDDKLPYDIVKILLEEYWICGGDVDQTYCPELFDIKIAPFIPDHLKNSFCTFNVSDVFFNQEKAIETIASITGRPATSSIRYLFDLYKKENVKLMEKYNLPYLR